MRQLGRLNIDWIFNRLRDSLLSYINMKMIITQGGGSSFKRKELSMEVVL